MTFEIQDDNAEKKNSSHSVYRKLKNKKKS